VRCAPADLDRILDVLLENALRYSPAATTVRLVATGPAIEVLDEGPGLAPGEEDAVFERFHRGTAGRAGPAGSGLGLPIARELAGEWAGSVAVANRGSGGLRATVRFPAGTADGPPSEADAADPAPAARGSGGRPRRAVAGAALVASVGIALAAGLSYTTGTLTSRRIGLSAEPIAAGAGLAPPRAAAERATDARPRRAARRTPAAAPTTTERRAGPPPAGPPPGAAPVPVPRWTAGPVSPRHGRDDYGGDAEGSGEADD